MSIREHLSRSLADRLGNPSTKRYVVQASAYALIVVTLLIGAACAYWIYRSGDLGAGAVTVLSFVAGITATLAGVAYRKAEEPKEPQP
jgi:prepilin signal peptidase PulO-like enzyme (type II secretory pathway)